MERDAGKDFFTLYKAFAIGAIPKIAKIPGFLLKRPLKNKLAVCDENVLKSLSRSMKAQDHRDTVGHYRKRRSNRYIYKSRWYDAMV